MADQETLRLAAEVVDKYSGPLREMQKALRRVADEVKGTHAQGTAYAKKHQEAVGVLGKETEKFEQRLRRGVTPALAALGVTTLTVAGAIAALKEATTGFADTTRQLTFLSRETGLTINQLRQFDAAARRLDTTPEAMRKGVAEFAQHMQNLRRMAPEELNIWRREWDANANNFLRSLSRNNQEALEQVIGFLDRIPTQQDKRKWLRMFGLPENFANLSGTELRKVMEEIRANIGAIGPEAQRSGLAFQEAMDRIAESVDRLKLTVGVELVGAFTEATDKLKEFVDENRDGLIAVLKEVSSQIKLALKDAHELLEEYNKLKSGDFSSITPTFSRPARPAGKWGAAVGLIENLIFGKQHSPLEMGHISGFASGGVVPRDMVAAVHKSEIIVPAGGGFGAGEALKKPVKEGTAEGTRKGVAEGLRDWFELNEGGAGGGGGGSFGGRGGAGGFRGGAGGPPGGAGEGAPSGHGAGFGAGGAIDIPQEPVGAAAGGPGGQRAGIDRSKWLKELNANPRLKEELYRHVIGENTNPLANQAAMEEAANRADVRTALHGGGGFGSHGNLAYFQGYRNFSAKERRMMDENFKKVFEEGSDIARGAIDNSSQWLSRKHEQIDHRFRTLANFGGDRITGHPGVETFEAPERGESGAGERGAWPGFRRHQLEQITAAQAANHKRLRDHFGHRGHGGDLLKLGKQSGLVGSGGGLVRGDASVHIKLDGFPRGTRTATTFSGLFSELTLNRGRAMVPADQNG
ncbi:MAG: hypothetical protein ABSA90_12520 [Xanthobacteraceae bacterium]|jgi:hypothetical protein